jgi:broad specificity phosphatase PhoE
MTFKNQIYIVRHGQSQNNIREIESGKFQTQKKYGLTDLGRAQVISSALKYKDFDMIYSSPFRRTLETAQLFAKYSECNVFENELLQEFDVGVYDEKPYSMMETYIHAPSNNIKEFPVRDGESWDQMYDRVKKFLDLLDINYKNKKILVVSHGSPVEAMIQVAQGINTSFGRFEDLPKNAEVIKLKDK